MTNSIKLVDINETNWDDFASMYPGDAGANFVAPNGYSMVQAYYEKTWTVKGIENNGIPIGFTMYGLDKDKNRYELCRFMMDYRQQGQGFGKIILPVILNEIIQTWQPNKIYLSTNPKNTKAIGLYEKLGFVETNEINDGEVVFCLTR